VNGPLRPLRDLRWRLKHLPPRTHLLVRWALQVHLGGVAALVASNAGLLVDSARSGRWGEAALVTLAQTLVFTLLFTAHGMWQGRRKPPTAAAKVSVVYDLRWSLFLKQQVLAAGLLSGLILSVVLLGRLVSAGGPAAHGPLPFIGTVLFVVGMNLVSEGAETLTVLLRDLPPPRPRTARARARPGVPGMAHPLI